jgi:cytoskeletal protein CcmA (bactofilin family)
MFSNKEPKAKAKAAEMGGGELNLIGTGTFITGDVNSSGDLRIDGSIRGNITSKARLVLGPNGKIEGDIHAQNAEIQGAVKGKLFIGEVLFLKATAVISGDIRTSKLVVEGGAEFNGSCNTKSAGRTEDATSGNEIKRPKQQEQAV